MSSDPSPPFPLLGEDRAAGVLLHLTSLAVDRGAGDTGPEAERFLDWLVAHGQRVWQTLPVTASGSHASPYDSRSSCAGEPLLVSADRLVDDGLLPARRLAEAPVSRSGGVDFGAVRGWKKVVIDEAWEGFPDTAAPALAADFAAFTRHPLHREWLDSWSLFAAFSAEHGEDWSRWPDGLRRRRPEAVASERQRLSSEIGRHRFTQWLFFRHWARLRRAARARGVLLMGDLPFYVARHSADVWWWRELFSVGQNGDLTAQSGVPPDAFSATGQLWGTPVYRWEAMAADGYRWWTRRLRLAFELFDLVRLDHFRGFVAHWEVGSDRTEAVTGEWRPGPGRRLFEAIEGSLGARPGLVAEDLGTITPDVERLRTDLGLPGMRVLQFAFDGEDDETAAANPHLPHHHESLAVVYTGTHDNPPTRAWAEDLDERRRRRLEIYLGRVPAEPHRDLLRLAYSSLAQLAVVPMQDLLGLGEEARMNTPGRAEGNWRWRLRPGQLAETDCAWVRELATLCSRVPRRSR